MNQLINGV